VFPELPYTTIIGFGNKARHGKDYSCQAIHENHPADTKIYSFATALKAYCRIQHGMTVKDGPLLQMIGTDDMRAQDPLVWVRTLYWQIAEEQPAYALIADMRFPNEAEFIKSLGGYIVRVTRVNADGSRYVAQDRDPNHPSEVALDYYEGWDKQIIAVSGDVTSLRRDALQVFDDVREMDDRLREGR
jgi:hypothetical protein